MGKVYELHAVDMTMVGAAMGLQREGTYFRKYFYSIDEAMTYAEKHYRKKTDRKIEWFRGPNDANSGDLSWVSYRIKPVEITVNTEDDGEV
jgi:hypothetical protein